MASPAPTTRQTNAPATVMATYVYLLLAICFGVLNFSSAAHQPAKSALETAKQWKLLTYNFLPNAPVNDVNFYNPMNVLATGIAVGKDRIFIATPKLFSGVSSTVNFVSKAEFGDSPVLQAYPDWSFSTTGRTDFNCSDLVLISTYRLRIDSCNRLWALDAGISRSLEDYEVTCPPKILVIDLETNQVIRRVDFPREVLRGESLFTNLIIDETTSKTGNCDDVFVYISDTVEPAIVVYDSGRDVTWRLSHPAMYPDPDFAQSEILNEKFILMDGVVGLTFDEKTGIIYFQPLATDRVFSVTKDVLRAGPLAQNQILQVKLVGKKSSQGIGLAISPIDGSLLFSPMSETAIAMWSPSTNRQAVLATDPERLQFVADLIVSRFDAGVVYALSSRFHRYFLKNLNPNEYNNRILRLKLPDGVSRSPAAVNLAHYSLAQSSPNFGGYYQANSYPKSQQFAAPPAPPSNYFSNSVVVASKQHPYSYEHVGVVNYSYRNPFTALNQGESFPPSKANRDPYQVSFLDTLASSPALTATHPLHGGEIPFRFDSHGVEHDGYYYNRGSRSVKAEQASPDTDTKTTAVEDEEVKATSP